jgi:phosphate-selective porin OprO and OprP
MSPSRAARVPLGPALLIGVLAWSRSGGAEELAPAGAVAPAAASTAELQRQLEQVDERSRILERKLELQEEATSKSKDAPVVVAGDKGFALKSANGAFVVKIRGIIHADARAFVGDDALGESNTLLLRRARPLIEASFHDVADFRLMPDFGNGQALVQDAYGDLRPFPWLKLRVGKFKPPVGLERLQSAAAIIFAERATPTSLVPNRDVGAQLHGDIAGGLVSYALGVFNGVLDGGSGDVDTGFAKDIAGRIFLQPLKTDPHSVLSGLGFGFAAATGNRQGRPPTLTPSGSGYTVTTASTPNLPSFKSAGQQTVFSYISSDKDDSTVLAQGRLTRLAPQGYYYLGPFGLIGEYVRSTHSVIRAGDAAKLNHVAWQLAATYLIGEGSNAYEGPQVRNPFDPKKGTLGVLELAARYNQLRLDDAAFPLYADPKKSVKRARGFAVALNWHWSRNVKLASTYEETHFTAGAVTGDRKTERVLFLRLQTAF